MKKRLMATICVALTGVMMFSGCSGKSADNAGKSGDGTVVQQSEVKASEGVLEAKDMSKLPDVAKNRKDTLVVGIDAPDGVFNPNYADSAYDVYITKSVFASLLSVTADGKPEADLAKEWKVSEDGTTYTFTLKDGVKFSDGTPVTAEDIAFTYTTMCDAAYDGQADFITEPALKGAKEYKAGTATSVEGIKVIDAKTISFTYNGANASAIYNFAPSGAAVSGILPKAVYGKTYKQGNLDFMKDLASSPIGAGPYKMTAFKKGQEVDLVANENYYKGTPKIKNLVYKVTTEATRMQQLQSGEIDMDMVTVNKDNVDNLKGSGFLTLNIFPTNGYGYIGINEKNPALADKAVRKALATGLDRKQIVDAVYQGYADVINIPQSKQSWAYAEAPNKYEFDLEKAKKLLDDAGWKPGADGIREKNGTKLSLRFAASTPNPVNDALIPVAKENYKALGVDFQAEQMEFNAVMAKRKSGDYDLYFAASGLSADPDCTTAYKTKGSQNFFNYSSAKVDDLLQKGLQTLDVEKRKTVYADLYKELNDDLPNIYMYQRRDMWAINGRLKGFDISPYKDFTSSLYKVEIK